MSETKFGYVILYVNDVLAAIDFYERAFRLKRRMVHESNTYAELETGATALAFVDQGAAPTAGLFTPSDASEKAPAYELAFVTEDVNELFLNALKEGANEVAPPATKPWGQIVAFVRDLNGVLVEICSPIAPRG